MTKTYPFEGKLYVESGENRVPKFGEVCLCDGVVTRCTNPNCDKAYPILVPAPSPRILTGYVSDAKAGDVYKPRDSNETWRLEQFAIPSDSEPFISMSDSENWGMVITGYTNLGGRWIVTPVEPPVEREAESVFIGNVLADATTDALARISQRADGLKAILLSKHEDYGGSVYKTPRFVPQATPRDAMLIRLGDKVERLERLLGGNKANVNESVDDTLLDLAGYALLILAEKETA